MWFKPYETTDLVISTEETLNGKGNLLCNKFRFQKKD